MCELLPPAQIAQLLAVSQNLLLCVLYLVTLTMTEKAERRNCIKFCQKLQHSRSETYDMIQKACGNEAMGHMQVKNWFRLFNEGWTSVKSVER
jgi:hypothetical protein